MSTIMSAFGSASQGMTSYKMGQEQWKTTKREMAYKSIQSAEEARQMEIRLAQIEGTQKARYGASGVKSEGSPMDVMLATEREGRGMIEYKKMMDAAQLYEMRKAGQLAKKAGGYAAMGSLFSGIGKAAGGVKDISENWGSKGIWSLLG